MRRVFRTAQVGLLALLWSPLAMAADGPPAQHDTPALHEHMAAFFGSAPINAATNHGTAHEGLPQTALAHDMAHGWLRLDEADPALSAWYAEGAAAFYGAALPYSLGQLTPEDFLAEMNRRAAAYYTHPSRQLGNAELAAQGPFADAVERVLSGRGFLYLLNTNAAIREASGGTQSLDDVVLEILQRQREGKSVRVADWLEIVTRKAGPLAAEQYAAMASGEIIIPRDDTLSPCFKPYPADITHDGGVAGGYLWQPVHDAARFGCLSDDGHAHEE